MPSNFYTSYKRALNTPGLFRQHRTVMDLLSKKRKNIVSKTDLFAEKKEQAHRLRFNALNRLPELLAEFEQNALANGMRIHWADTCEDGNRIIERILAGKNARRIIKGKSMISEEMHVNHYLEERGYDVVESDLGELIVQLAKEVPSHIIAPAIHKNVRQIARIFHEKLDMPYSEEIKDLIGFARQYMREKYIRADAGISGVNFAIANTGSLCLVENEGNGRFTTTVPKLHIAVMSLDKVTETLSDLDVLLEVLTKSATGQRITAYVNIISGPRRRNEKDGPEEVHVVILNNHRTEILKDRLLRETLKCIRCGACINNCPIYVNIGGHAYNSIIPGPIGKILMPQLYGMDEKGDLATASSLCGACVDVCPVKIPITDILLKLRAMRVKKTESGKFVSGFAGAVEIRAWKFWAVIFSNPLLYSIQRKLCGRFAFTLNRHFPILKQWMKYREKPAISKTTLSELAKQEGFYDGK